jgi:hypothetical protein
VGLVGLASLGAFVPGARRSSPPPHSVVAGGNEAPAASVAVLPPNVLHTWSGQDGDPRRYRIGTVDLTVGSNPQSGEGIAAELTAPGLRPARFRDEQAVSLLSFGVGRIDTSRPEPQVLLSFYTGGMHCCGALVLFTPEAGGWREVRLGAWQDARDDGWPQDRDGDGAPEFNVSDDRFYSAFSSNSGSYAPRRIVQVRNGKLIDVSRRPAFRAIHQADLTEMEEACRAHSNGACAAFMADAILLGREAWAWTVVRKHYDRGDNWGVKFGCDPRISIQTCPAGLERDYRDFPEALAAFLRQTGYLAK